MKFVDWNSRVSTAHVLSESNEVITLFAAAPRPQKQKRCLTPSNVGVALFMFFMAKNMTVR